MTARADGFTLNQAVSHQPLNARTRVLFRTSVCEVYGEQSGSGISYSLSTLVLRTIPPMVRIHLYQNVAVIRRMNGRSLGNIPHYNAPQKNSAFINRAALDRKLRSLFQQRAEPFSRYKMLHYN
jgi:hypothetical protein